MSRFYTANFSAVAVTVAQDLFSLLAPATAIVVIHEIELGQTSEIGDAQEEMLAILLRRGIGATVGSGGSTMTPSKHETGAAAASSVVRINDTTAAVAGGGSLTLIRPTMWNERVPYLYVPTPETRIVLSPSERFVVNLNTAPADSVTISGSLVFEEIGG